MQENCIKIHNGSKKARSIIEIQNYITQLEMEHYRLKNRFKEIQIVSQQYDKLKSDYNDVKNELECVNTELAYYQALVISKNNGRPAKLSTQQIYEIRQLRQNGKTLQTIANQYEVSSALVHKLTKDIKIDRRKK